MARFLEPRSRPWRLRLRRGRAAQVTSAIVAMAANGFGILLILINTTTYFSGKVKFDPQIRTNSAEWASDQHFDGDLNSLIANYVGDIMHTAAKGELNPLQFHNEFDNIDNNILNYSWKDYIVRRITGVSEYHKAQVIVSTIVTPLIGCVNQLRSEMPSSNDARGMRNFAMTLYGIKNLAVQSKPFEDILITEEEFTGRRERARRDFAQCKRIHAGVGRYINDKFGARNFDKFKDFVDENVASGALRQEFNTMINNLNDTKLSSYSYNLRDYYNNISNIERNNAEMAEYANKIFSQKCSGNQNLLDSRRDRSPPSTLQPACDGLTIELMNIFSKQSKA